jgi:uncharacterized cupredoxin-like copper-binding protein
MIRAQLPMIAVICILALAPAARADSSKAETVTLVGTDYEFAPNRLTFRVGSAYRLHFENRGKELHEFTAPAFLKTVEIDNPEVLNPEGTEIVVQPGEEKDLRFVPRQVGRFPFMCADHDWAGMTGDIAVE